MSEFFLAGIHAGAAIIGFVAVIAAVAGILWLCLLFGIVVCDVVRSWTK